MNSQVAAMQKNDLTAMRSNFSQGTLKMFEKAAQAQKISSDEVLASISRQNNATNKEGAAETRNEQIIGDAATLEIKNPVTGGWDKIPFVKEEGRWKIALDKFMEDILKQTEEPAAQ
ncbi:MAG: nuclear transport factor 2 family protein [Pyrinomonadaceae bacterium]